MNHQPIPVNWVHLASPLLLPSATLIITSVQDISQLTSQWFESFLFSYLSVQINYINHKGYELVCPHNQCILFNSVTSFTWLYMFFFSALTLTSLPDACLAASAYVTSCVVLICCTSVAFLLALHPRYAELCSPPQFPIFMLSCTSSTPLFAFTDCCYMAMFLTFITLQWWRDIGSDFIADVSYEYSQLCLIDLYHNRQTFFPPFLVIFRCFASITLAPITFSLTCCSVIAVGISKMTPHTIILPSNSEHCTLFTSILHSLFAFPCWAPSLHTISNNPFCSTFALLISPSILFIISVSWIGFHWPNDAPSLVSLMITLYSSLSLLSLSLPFVHCQCFLSLIYFIVAFVFSIYIYYWFHSNPNLTSWSITSFCRLLHIHSPARATTTSSQHFLLQLLRLLSLFFFFFFFFSSSPVFFLCSSSSFLLLQSSFSSSASSPKVSVSCRYLLVTQHWCCCAVQWYRAGPQLFLLNLGAVDIVGLLLVYAEVLKSWWMLRHVGEGGGARTVGMGGAYLPQPFHPTWQHLLWNPAAASWGLELWHWATWDGRADGLEDSNCQRSQGLNLWDFWRGWEGGASVRRGGGASTSSGTAVGGRSRGSNRLGTKNGPGIFTHQLLTHVKNTHCW